MRFLIVEDDPLVAEMLQNFLEGHGHRVILAGTGEEGLRAAVEEMPDAVFLDVVLPDLSGLRFLERLKRLGRSMTVIAISGQATEEQARECLRLGALEYLSKPFNLGQLDLILQVLGVAR